MRRISLILIALYLIVSTLFAGELSFSKFQFITDNEVTILNDRIKFFNGDTIWNRIHSNDEIAIMQSPVFYGRLTTSARDFWQGPSYNPIFFLEPIFNYPEAVFTEEASTIRAAALQSGTFFANPGGLEQFRVLFECLNGMKIWRWPLGIPFNDTTAALIYTCPPDYEGRAYFLEGRTELIATDPDNQIDYGIAGRYSIGASGDIWILGNLRYIDSNLRTGAVDSATTNCLGLVSEQNIIIANTEENGRDNGAAQTSTWFKDVILNGAFLALNESFTFESQNDDSSLMGGTLPYYFYSNGPTPDERGQIHLWGSIAQSRRGYVHRSNHGGTGYLKDYHYYNAIGLNPPPYFPYQEIELTLTQTVMNFGQVVIGDTMTVEIPFFNYSMDSIALESLTFSCGAFSGEIQPDSLFCPNDTSNFVLRFHPLAVTFYNESLTMITSYEGNYLISLTGEGIDVGLKGEQNSASPGDFRLLAVYPNPFNRETAFRFSSSAEAELQLKIFNLTGDLIYQSAEIFPAGEHIWEWSPWNLSSGIYFYQLSHSRGRLAGKLLYLQ